MVIILFVCLEISGKTTNIGSSNELLADFKLYKEQKKKKTRLLLKHLVIIYYCIEAMSINPGCWSRGNRNGSRGTLS